ncbi:MAG TPA: conjugal transfer protein TraR [Bacteroidetes bacterium]|nr:conjugal transfer protein TraR [Bacteroidota bacterium]
MVVPFLIFSVALTVLIFSARIFTSAAEKIGLFFGLPPLVIGIFIVGIGTSLPELVSAIFSVRDGVSEVATGNVLGANISNILFITGVVALVHRVDIHLSSKYIFIDLHYLIGSIFAFTLFAYDGVIDWHESVIGIIIFLVFSIYLLKTEAVVSPQQEMDLEHKEKFPWLQLLWIIAGCLGIYFGADYTISSLSEMAVTLDVPPSIVALTVLSIGTSLPELVVNVAAIRQGKAEMAIGNVLGSSVFNCLMVPSIASFFGPVQVPSEMLHLALPVMVASALFFYLITHDKRISRWEGMLFILLYFIFLLKVVESQV